MPVREPGLRLLSGAANAHRGLDGQPAAGPVRGTVGTSRLPGLVYPNPQTAARTVWGQCGPAPVYRGLCTPTPKTSPGRCREPPITGPGHQKQRSPRGAVGAVSAFPG